MCPCVEKHLTLTRNRNERGPRAGCHIGNGRTTWSGHNRLQQNMLRQWWWTIGLTHRWCRLKRKSGLLLFLRFPGFVFQQSSINPCPDQIGFLLPQFLTLWRHLRFQRMGNHAIHAGIPSFTGLRDFPSRTTTHECRVGAEIKPPFLLIRIMAVRTRLLKNRQNVVLEIRRSRSCYRNRQSRVENGES